MNYLLKLESPQTDGQCEIGCESMAVYLCLYFCWAITSEQPVLCGNKMSWGLDTFRLDSLDCYIMQWEHTGPIFTPPFLLNTHMCTCTNAGMRIHAEATCTRTCSHTTDM